MGGCYNIEKIDNTYLKLTKSGGFFGKKKEFFVPESEFLGIVDSVTVKPNNKYKIQGTVKIERVNSTMYKFTGEKGNVVVVPERDIVTHQVDGFEPNQYGQMPTIGEDPSPECATGKYTYIPYSGPALGTVGKTSEVQPSQPPASARPASQGNIEGGPTQLMKTGGYRRRMTKRARRPRRRYSRRYRS